MHEGSCKNGTPHLKSALHESVSDPTVGRTLHLLSRRCQVEKAVDSTPSPAGHTDRTTADSTTEAAHPKQCRRRILIVDMEGLAKAATQFVLPSLAIKRIVTDNLSPSGRSRVASHDRLLPCTGTPAVGPHALTGTMWESGSYIEALIDPEFMKGAKQCGPSIQRPIEFRPLSISVTAPRAAIALGHKSCSPF
jgi:hypothetical protein